MTAANLTATPITISFVTRRAIQDMFAEHKVDFSGRLNDAEFLGRLFDLDSMPSEDPRKKNFREDILMHRVSWPNDWASDWVWTDSRVALLSCPDEQFLRFLAEVVHPMARPEPEDAVKLVGLVNKLLRVDGYGLVEGAPFDNRATWTGMRSEPVNDIETRV